MSLPLPKFEYRKARTVEEAIFMFLSYDGRALYLAGGTDLVPRLKHRLEKPMALIDIKGIEELKGIEEINGFLSIGSLETLFDLKENPRIRELFPALYESLDKTSCETLQMRGTIGGNILQDTRCIYYNQSEFWRRSKGFCYKMGGDRCNAVKGGKKCLSVYMGDNAPSLITLDARLVLEGAEGERTVKVHEIFSGRGKSPIAIKEGEILKRILIPLGRTEGGYEKLRIRGSIDYPLIGVSLTKREGSSMISFTAVGPRPLYYNLDGNPEDILERAYNDALCIPNTVLSPAYRKKMVKVLGEALIERIMGG